MRNIHHISNNIITYLYLLLPHICSSIYDYYTLLLITNFKPIISFVTLHIFYTDTKNYDIYEIDILIFSIIVLKDSIYINHLNNLILIFLALCVYKNIMGLGDLKLFIILALNLSTLQFYQTLFISSFLCLIYALIQKTNKIPYGPFIMIAYLIL